MAPLMNLHYHKKDYLDSDMLGVPNQLLPKDVWNEGLANEARPTERKGLQGGFTHGVTVFRGGVPHHKIVPDADADAAASRNTTVLHTFDAPHLQPDVKYEQQYKPGTQGYERLGRNGGAMWRMPRKSQDQPIGQAGNPGTVLYTFDKLKPDLSGEALTNDVGGRPTERRGLQGGFKRGRPIWSGGCARDVPMAPEILNRGVILYVSEDPASMPDMSHVPQVKPGTEDCERSGRVGSFEHGDTHLAWKLWRTESWEELGQIKNYRRCGPGHFASGSSVKCGIHLGPKEYKPDFQMFKQDVPFAAAAV